VVELGNAQVLITLLALASFVAVIARRVNLPYTIALVMVGLLIGLSGVIEPIELTPQLVLVVALPSLIFEASIHLEWRGFRQNMGNIFLFAIPGVVLTTGIVSALLRHFVGLPWTTALLFGAIIAPTDPVSVSALFKEVGAPRRLAILIEGESLFNDGVALVLYRVLQIMALSAAAHSPISGAIDFVRVAVGGAFLGMATGYTFSQIIKTIDEHLIEITMSVALAYGTYIVAENLHVSGVIAVVVAGLVVGNYASRIAMSATTKINLRSFWEYLAFFMNTIIFLLIGLQSNILPRMAANAVPILIAIFALLLARVVSIYGLGYLSHRWFRRLPFEWYPVLIWGGLKGSLSLAMALALSNRLAYKELLVAMTYGCVLFSLLVQGLSIAPLVARLPSVRRSPLALQVERLRGSLLSLQSSWRALRESHEDGLISEPVWQRLSSEFRLSAQQLSEQLSTLYSQHQELLQEELRITRHQALQEQRSSLQELLRRGVICEDTFRDLVAEADARLAQLDQQPDSQE